MNPISETVRQSAVGAKYNAMVAFFKAIRKFLPLKLIVQASWLDTQMTVGYGIITRILTNKQYNVVENSSQFMN